MTAARTGTPHRPLRLVPGTGIQPPKRTPDTTLAGTQLGIEPEVADHLIRCAASAGLSVSTLLRALLAVRAPTPSVGDLVRCAQGGSSVYQITALNDRQQAHLSRAHGLHPAGCIRAAGWTPFDQVRRLEPIDR